jgi:hypothetical protein
MAMGPTQSIVVGYTYPDLDGSEFHIGQRPLRHTDLITAAWRGGRRPVVCRTARRIARPVSHRRVW